MKIKLEQISNDLNKGVLTEIEAREQLLTLLKVGPEVLEEYDLEIYNHGYEVYQLRQQGQVIQESDELSCHEFAFRIISNSEVYFLIVDRDHKMYHPEKFPSRQEALDVIEKEYVNRDKNDGYDDYWRNREQLVRKIAILKMKT